MSLDITNINNLYATSRSIFISSEIICQNIINEKWQFENYDKTISIDTEYIEKIIFSILRDIPVINIKLLNYYDGESEKYIILNSEKQLLSLLFYFKGLVVTGKYTIKHLLNCLKNEDLDDFKKEDFSLKLSNKLTSLNFQEIPTEVQNIILKENIPVAVCTINNSNMDSINFIKDMFKNS